MKNLLDILTSKTVLTLGWAVIHSVWQICLIVGLYVLAAQFTKNASKRYWMGMALVFIQLLASIFTFFYLQQSNLPIQDGAATNSFTTQNPIIGLLNQNLYLIVFSWLVGSTLLFMRLLAGYWQVHLLKTNVHNTENTRLQAMCENLKVKMGVQHGVKIMVSEHINLPMIMGIVKPLILIPSSVLLGFSTEQLEVIIAHELAHLKRHDYLLNGLQSIIEIMFFFHPAMWWLSDQIRNERENACDDMAVLATNKQFVLAKTLIQLQERKSQSSLAMAFGKSKLGFSNRIQRILGIDHQGNLNKESLWLLAGIVIMFCVISNTNAKQKGPKIVPIKYNNTLAKSDTLITDSTIINKVIIKTGNRDSKEIRVEANRDVSVRNNKDLLELKDGLAYINGKEVSMTPEKKAILKQSMENIKLKNDQIKKQSEEMSAQSEKMQKHSEKIVHNSKPIEDLSNKMGTLGNELSRISMNYSIRMNDKKRTKADKENLSKVFEKEMKSLEVKMEGLQKEMEVHTNAIEELEAPMLLIEKEMEKLEGPIEQISQEIEKEFEKVWSLLPKDIQNKFNISPPSPPKPPKIPRVSNSMIPQVPPIPPNSLTPLKPTKAPKAP